MLKINHFTKLFFSGILLLCFSGAFAQEQEDRLLQLMKRDDFLARIKLIANDKLTPHKRA